MDSNLLAASSLVSHNAVLRFWRFEREDTRVRVTRLATLAAGLVACALAVSRDSVYRLVEESSAFGGAGMFVAMAFELRTRFGGRRAGLAAMLAGMATRREGPHHHLTGDRRRTPRDQRGRHQAGRPRQRAGVVTSPAR